MAAFGTTLNEHIRRAEDRHPQATGALTGLLYELALATKVVSREVNRAGLLAEMLGLTGETNVHGEQVQKLDQYAHDTLVRLLGRSGRVALLGSEEDPAPILIPAEVKPGSYVVLFDPLDGSSNIDVAGSIGTIFSIYRMRGTSAADGGELVRCGGEQVAAGYVIYGSSTILVYTAREGVHGFTLDPTVGEYLLSHQNVRCPPRGSTYSVNEGNSARWSKSQRRLVEWFKESDPGSGRPYSLRYVGSLVADFHRTLLKGGVFMYPGDADNPRGKLRYLYEAAPLALIAEEAGAAAWDGERRILEIAATALHERTPLYIGSREDVATAVGILRG